MQFLSSIILAKTARYDNSLQAVLEKNIHKLLINIHRHSLANE